MLRWTPTCQRLGQFKTNKIPVWTELAQNAMPSFVFPPGVLGTFSPREVFYLAGAACQWCERGPEEEWINILMSRCLVRESLYLGCLEIRGFGGRFISVQDFFTFPSCNLWTHTARFAGAFGNESIPKMKVRGQLKAGLFCFGQ